MTNIMVLPSKQGAIVLFAQDILALTEGKNNTTDVYTTIFPQGITVDIPLDHFMPQFLSALNGEEDDDEGPEVNFTPDFEVH